MSGTTISTLLPLVGPFDSEDQAEVWAKENGWAEGYDPRWRIRGIRTPWSGAMQDDGSINSRQEEK